jgi:hypothetical protein
MVETATDSALVGPFRFQQVKDDRVFIYHQHRHVVTLAGDGARRFLQRAGVAEGEALQLLMAKATKNFKRGNERPTR